MRQRTTFAFDPTTSERLSRLAKKKGISNTELVRRAIALYETVEQERDPSSAVKFQDKAGNTVNVVLP
ncbi:MAG TPA: ribbon-helix-helix domain-containing protein [Longimicrobium sp.]|jgi:predicted transcriptional regulator|nr:ribbon-helix-helix domain-containing protein [Longimicrobium sp.]